MSIKAQKNHAYLKMYGYSKNRLLNIKILSVNID